MESLICCCGSRSWTRVIAWIQIVIFSIGLLLAAGGLMVLLVAGKDAVDKVTQEIPHQKGSVAFGEWNLVMPSEYSKLVINLVICIIILFLGNILAVFLIKGATENKSRYLRWWVIYSVICLAWIILTEMLIVSVDKVFAFLRRSVFCSVYGFSIFVVVRLIREIDAGEQLRKNGLSGFGIENPSFKSWQILPSPPNFPSNV